MPNRKQKIRKDKIPPTLLIGSTSDDDSVQQFELELQWCIQQLEGSMSTNKLTAKQAQDAAYSLTVLQSKNAPVIKKRQVMRSSFGDYRKKMTEEEKKLMKAQDKVHIAALSPNDKSCFVKRSSVVNNKVNCNSSEDNFRFNFNIPSSELKMSNQEDTKDSCFVYKSSDNSFRFNFEQSSS